MLTNRDFLMWLHERLVSRYGENPLFDYMHKLRKIADEQAEAQAEIERLKEALKDIIDECTGFTGCEDTMRMTAERALASNLQQGEKA